MAISPKVRLALGLVAILAVSAFVLSPVGVSDAEAADEKPARRWILNISHGPLKTVLVDVGLEAPQSFHYQVLKITNKTGDARPWHPHVRAVTDTADTQTKGGLRTYVAGTYRMPLEAIRRAEKNANLQPIGAKAGKFAAGETREVVAIFGPLDNLYDRVKIQVYGLADGVATYRVKMYGSEPEGKRIPEDAVIGDSAYYERNQEVIKTLRSAAADGAIPEPKVAYMVVGEKRFYEMVYERLGDEIRAEDDLITYVSEGWKVDGEPTYLRTLNKKAE